MRYILENDVLRAEIESFGAELKSVKSKATGQEYMWYADAKFWGRTSPVLFPFVGSIMNKEFRYDGKTYPMGQHGFARDMEFSLISQDADSIWFSLLSTEETLAKYPFAFELKIGYRLQAEELEVLWEVKNPGQQTAPNTDQPLYFSIGAHPAFICPIHGEDSKAGYQLFFEGLDEVHHHGNLTDTGMALREDLVIPLKDHRATITPDFFDRCTIMVEGKQTGCVGIEDPSGKRFITMRFDTPLFAIWSPEGKNAPFLCIEPWFGRCDAVDFSGTLEEREYTNVLGENEVFHTSYSIRFE